VLVGDWPRHPLSLRVIPGLCGVGVGVGVGVGERLRSLEVCLSVQVRGVVTTVIVFECHEPGKCNVCGIMDWQVRVS